MKKHLIILSFCCFLGVQPAWCMKEKFQNQTVPAVPDEIVCLIFDFISSYNILVRLKVVCKQFKHILENGYFSQENRPAVLLKIPKKLIKDHETFGPTFKMLFSRNKFKQRLQKLKKLLGSRAVSIDCSKAWLCEKHLVWMMEILKKNLVGLNNWYDHYLGDEMRADLFSFTKLRSLCFYKCWKMKDEHAKQIAKLTNLESLGLRHNELTDDGLNYLVVLTKLKHLNLSSSDKITDDGIAKLMVLTDLEHVDLSFCDVTIQVIEHLAKLPSLQCLKFEGNKELTDQWFFFISKRLPNLKELSCNNCEKITDRGLRNIAFSFTAHFRFLKLSHLEFFGCERLTDEGLKHLGEMSNLKFLYLPWNGTITGRGVRALQEKLPNVEIKGAISF